MDVQESFELDHRSGPMTMTKIIFTSFLLPSSGTRSGGQGPRPHGKSVLPALPDLLGRPDLDECSRTVFFHDGITRREGPLLKDLLGRVIQYLLLNQQTECRKGIRFAIRKEKAMPENEEPYVTWTREGQAGNCSECGLYQANIWRGMVDGISALYCDSCQQERQTKPASEWPEEQP